MSDPIRYNVVSKFVGCPVSWEFQADDNGQWLEADGALARITVLEAEVERLKAPVSDEECRTFQHDYGEKLMLNYVDFGLSDFLAVRAARTKDRP